MKSSNAKSMAMKLGFALAFAGLAYACLAYASLSSEFRHLGLR